MQGHIRQGRKLVMFVIGTSPVFLTTIVQVPAPAGVATRCTWSIIALGLLPAMLAKLKKTPETATAAATVIAISRTTATNGLKPTDVFLLNSTISPSLHIFIGLGIQPAQTITTVIRAKPHDNMQPNNQRHLFCAAAAPTHQSRHTAMLRSLNPTPPNPISRRLGHKAAKRIHQTP
jgi:hypothetical protein